MLTVAVWYAIARELATLGRIVISVQIYIKVATEYHPKIFPFFCGLALYKRTCEELALLGYMKSGVYEIDIDGNGPHPPAHVRCEFEPHSGLRKTVVEHNLPRDTVKISRIPIRVQLKETIY